MGVRVGLRVSVRIRALAAIHTSIAQQAPQVKPAGARLRGVKRGNQRRGLRDVTHGAHQAGWWRHAGLAGTKAGSAQKGCRVRVQGCACGASLGDRAVLDGQVDLDEILVAAQQDSAA